MALKEIENYVRQGNIDGYTRIRATINNPNGSVPPTSANHHVYQPNPTVPANQNQFLIANGLPNPTVPSMPTMPTQTYGVGIVISANKSNILCKLINASTTEF